MVVEATPSTPLVIAQAEVLFEVLIVLFDPPTQLGRLDEGFDRGFRWHGRKPILGRLSGIFGPSTTPLAVVRIDYSLWK